MGFTYLYKGVSHSVAEDHRVLTTRGVYLEDDVTIDVESSSIEDVATTAAMTAKIIPENDGKMFHFTGITDTYINGAYYRIKATTVTPSVTINQKSSTSYGFQNSSALSLDQSQYYGLFESDNYHVRSSYAVAKITFKNAPNFTLWFGSYGQAAYDYAVASKIDASTYPTSYNHAQRQNDTRNYSKNPSGGLNTNNFRKQVYTNDGGEHFIYVVYLKNGSTDQNNDRGYYAIEKPQPVTTVIAEEFVQVSGVKTLSNLQSADVKQFASAVVDSTNISAGNIKAGVSILGITGSYSGETPTGKLLITDTAEKDVSSYATAQVSEPNLVAGNIKAGVNVLGISGIFDKLFAGRKYHAHTVTQLIGNNEYFVYAEELNESFGDYTRLVKDIYIINLTWTKINDSSFTIMYSSVVTNADLTQSYISTFYENVVYWRGNTYRTYQEIPNFYGNFTNIPQNYVSFKADVTMRTPAGSVILFLA